MAYELAGDNRKALQWVNEVLRRDPAARNGTGWLHLQILDTKLKLGQDPAWLKTRHVIALDDKQLATPDFSYKLGERVLSRRDVETALLNQLKERMMLVKSNDPVVADLLYTLALMQKGTQVYSSASDLLQLAGQYGYAVPARLLAELKIKTAR